jgi:hypothetical protein
MQSTLVSLYREYVNAWSAISDHERREILHRVLATDAVYRIPRMEGKGHQIVIDDMNEFQAKMPGGKFALHSTSGHHNVALMEWQLILPNGTAGVLGHDAIRLGIGSKLEQIITFAPSALDQQSS